MPDTEAGPLTARTDLTESKAGGKGTIGRAMIEHLRGRERALEPLGWTGREAEWIALVCLHSGIFTRPQFCRYFETHRVAAHRFVQALLKRRVAVESGRVIFSGGAEVCLISGKAIYRALGAGNIRLRRKASPNVVMRRLLSLDFVLEHPRMNWLPTEAEKVEFFESLGLDRRMIPRRTYYGAVGKQQHYFALKLPIAVDSETATFVYADPGNGTDTEIRTWGAAHARLWDAVREKGRQVRVIAIAAEHEPIDRAKRVLRRWAATPPGKPSEGLTVKQEIKLIGDAMTHSDEDVLAEYGGFGEAMRRCVELERLPEAKVPEGVSINGYSTWRATRFSQAEGGYAAYF